MSIISRDVDENHAYYMLNVEVIGNQTHNYYVNETRGWCFKLYFALREDE